MPEEMLIEEMECVYKKPHTLTDDYMHYCPGCGHAVAHKILMEVVDEMGIQEDISVLRRWVVLCLHTTI